MRVVLSYFGAVLYLRRGSMHNAQFSVKLLHIVSHFKTIQRKIAKFLKESLK